jgi:hypothetical protein
VFSRPKKSLFSSSKVALQTGGYFDRTTGRYLAWWPAPGSGIDGRIPTKGLLREDPMKEEIWLTAQGHFVVKMSETRPVALGLTKRFDSVWLEMSNEQVFAFLLDRRKEKEARQLFPQEMDAVQRSRNTER